MIIVLECLIFDFMSEVVVFEVIESVFVVMV